MAYAPISVARIAPVARVARVSAIRSPFEAPPFDLEALAQLGSDAFFSDDGGDYMGEQLSLEDDGEENPHYDPIFKPFAYKETGQNADYFA